MTGAADGDRAADLVLVNAAIDTPEGTEAVEEDVQHRGDVHVVHRGGDDIAVKLEPVLHQLVHVIMERLAVVVILLTGGELQAGLALGAVLDVLRAQGQELGGDTGNLLGFFEGHLRQVVGQALAGAAGHAEDLDLDVIGFVRHRSFSFSCLFRMLLIDSQVGR